MKRLVILVVAAGAICLGAYLLKSDLVFAAQTTTGNAVLQADNSLQRALKSKDTKTAGTLLDQDFTWTNELGETRRRVQFLQEAAGNAPDSATEYSNVKAREYGELAIVTGTAKHPGRPDTFFARIWVKPSERWLLLTHQDTAIVAKGSAPPAASAAGSGSAAPGNSDCDNPCRTLPYKPQTEAQTEVVKAYQSVETAVVSHDPKTWADHVADEFVGVGRVYTGTPDTKAGRVGQIGVVTNRVVLPKMIRGEAHVFGSAAILIADHQPAGEPPYHVIRVWVKRDGRWQLFHRQETTIQKPPAPKVASLFEYQ